MTINGIDHLELYVGDARQAAFYFDNAVGFRLRGQGGPETGAALVEAAIDRLFCTGSAAPGARLRRVFAERPRVLLRLRHQPLRIGHLDER